MWHLGNLVLKHGIGQWVVPEPDTDLDEGLANLEEEGVLGVQQVHAAQVIRETAPVAEPADGSVGVLVPDGRGHEPRKSWQHRCHAEVPHAGQDLDLQICGQAHLESEQAVALARTARSRHYEAISTTSLRSRDWSRYTSLKGYDQKRQASKKLCGQSMQNLYNEMRFMQS